MIVLVKIKKVKFNKNMRLFLIFIISTFCFSFNSVAQKNISLKIEWNLESKRYEVIAVSQKTQKNVDLGESQISIVLPSTAPNEKFLIVSFAGGSWIDSKVVASPSASAKQDFHGITSSGSAINLTANQDLLLFSFTFLDGSCHDGIRIFSNGSDPLVQSEELGEVDFSNFLTGSSSKLEFYNTNISNTGTKCTNCPVEFTVPKLKKLQDR